MFEKDFDSILMSKELFSMFGHVLVHFLAELDENIDNSLICPFIIRLQPAVSFGSSLTTTTKSASQCLESCSFNTLLYMPHSSWS